MGLWAAGRRLFCDLHSVRRAAGRGGLEGVEPSKQSERRIEQTASPRIRSPEMNTGVRAGLRAAPVFDRRPEELFGELAGGLGAFGGILFQALHHHPLNLRGHFALGVGFLHRRGHEVEMGPDHGHAVTTEGTYACQKMIEHHAR